MTSIEKEFKIKPNTYRYEIYKALSENLEDLSLRDIMSRRGIHKTKAIYAISEIKKISNLSNEELKNMFIEMEDVLVHNKKLLHTFSRKNYLEKELFEIYN